MDLARAETLFAVEEILSTHPGHARQPAVASTGKGPVR